MALQTSQSLDSILLNNLLFRNTANAPISSMYTLYANGRGQTFWAPSVSPANLSSFSTIQGSDFSTLNSYINALNLSYTNLSNATFSDFSNIEAGIVSSSSAFNTSIGLLSNLLNSSIVANAYQYQIFSNATTVQVNNVYTSTMNIVYSTISSINNGFNYTSQLSNLSTSISANFSTCSSLILRGDQQVFSTISSYITTSALFSSIALFVGDNVSSLSSALVNTFAYSTMNSSLMADLFSTSASLSSTFQSSYTMLYDRYNSLQVSTTSSYTSLNSTTINLQSQITNLELFSTNLSSIIYTQASSFAGYEISSFNDTYSKFTSTLVNNISILTISTNVAQSSINSLQLAINSYSSIYSVNFSTIDNSINELNFLYSTLTTSSILTGVWETFNELEDYTTNIINSTILTVGAYRSTLQTSTTIYSVSTTNGLIESGLSSLYSSTISTIVPINNMFISSLLSSYISTYTFIVGSSIQSTTVGKSIEFTNIVENTASTIVSSYNSQMISSILTYLSSPAGTALVNFSTFGGLEISTFNGLGTSTIANQSLLFNSTYISNQTAMNSQFVSTNNIISSLYGYNAFYVSSVSVIYSTIVESTIRFFSTTNFQFTSSMAAFASYNNTQITSTLTGVNTNITIQTYNTLTILNASTQNTYNSFVASLNAAQSTVSLSTLYTSQYIGLNSTTYEATMDFATFRNFNIYISSPIYNGSSNYRLTYNYDGLQSLNYRRGIISIDVNTIGNGYSNNNGKLLYDFNISGIPTSIFSEVYPSISSVDYTLMYEYNILNSVVYANLLNVFPRLRLSALTLSAVQNYNVFVGTLPQSNYFWRGSQINLNWSNYSFFPYGAVGAAPFNPQIGIDVIYNNKTSRYGPYTFNISTASISLPYITETVANPVLTTVKAYVIGKPMEAQTINLFTLVPQFNAIRMRPTLGNFLTLQDIVYQPDSAIAVTYTIRMLSSTGTGWGGAIMEIRESGGTLIATFGSTFTGDNSYQTTTVGLISGRTYNLFWTAVGGGASVGLQILTQNGGLIYTKDPGVGSVSSVVPLRTFIASATSSAAVNVYGSDPGNSNMSFLPSGGSLSFAGTQTSYLSIPNDPDFQLGTGNFTIEWFQYTTSSQSNARSFAVGNAINVSFERVASAGMNVPRITLMGSTINFPALGSQIEFKWVHFALTRSGTAVRFYVDGALYGNFTSSVNINDTVSPLVIGNDNTLTAAKSFTGQITNFHWVKGTSLYSSGSFIKPSSPIIPIPDSRLLLNTISQATAIDNTVSVVKVISRLNVIFNYSSPFGSFAKQNAIDSDSAAIFVGPTSSANPDLASYLEIVPPTSVYTSSISILNIASSCNIMRGGVGNGAAEMQNTTLTAEVIFGGITYGSTITLNSTATQVFRF